MSRVADTTTERAYYYRTVCGLPCAPDGQCDRILLYAWDIGAMTLPISLAECVHSRLVAAGTPAPVIAHSNHRWTLLTRPHQLGGDLVLAARLNSLNIQLVPPGATLLMPAPQDERAGRLWWVLKPRDMFRPSMDTVLNSLDDVLAARVGPDFPPAPQLSSDPRCSSVVPPDSPRH